MCEIEKKIPHDQAYVYCVQCGAEYSATPGDYWGAPDNLGLECCVPMALVVKGGRFKGDSIAQESVTVSDLRRMVTEVGEAANV